MGRIIITIIGTTVWFFFSTSFFALAQTSFKANFSAFDVCSGDTSFFTNLSQIPDSLLPVDYYWNFGDGSISADSNPSHHYTPQSPFEKKEFLTTLKIISREHPEFADSFSQILKLHALPNASFSITQEYDAQNYAVRTTGPVTQNPTLSYKWSFCGIQASQQITPYWRFERFDMLKSLEVSLLIINHEGCEGMSTQYVDTVDWFEMSVPMSNLELGKIIPNPTSGPLSLPDGVQLLTVFDSMGKLVLETKNPSQEIQLDLLKGIYFIWLNFGNIVSTQRIIVE